MSPTRQEKVRAFRALHESGCFIMPNPWDIGGARIMAAAGFKALATTSSGFAFAIGRRDGEVGRDGTLAHAAEIAAATDLPVNADTEDCYAETPDGVAETVRLAAEAGLAGMSIEDRQPDPDRPIRDREDAVARVAVAVEAARRHDIVLTARADGLAKKAYDLEEAIARIRLFEELGAEVLYVPGIPDAASLRAVCAAVKRPVNHLLGAAGTGIAHRDIVAAGVRRISLGGSLARAMGGVLRETCRAIAGGDFRSVDGGPTFAELRGG